MAPSKKTSVFGGRVCALLLAAVTTASSACQVIPPRYAVPGRAGIVRADDADRALEVAALLDDIAPRIALGIPGLSARGVEVWVQEKLALYRYSRSSYADADGFWAEGPGRIHLCASADNLARTLAHELVHASLDSTWRALPGTLEEGLCDWVSVHLAPGGAARMRAGRLSSAAFATGGLTLELVMSRAADSELEAAITSSRARVKLDGDPPVYVVPEDVFRVRAGLSSTSLSSEAKRGLYGMSYVVVERIAERGGLAKLYELCERAQASGLSSVPRAWLLEAAELDLDPRSWQAAVESALGPAELTELVRMHPEFMVEALARYAGASDDRPAGTGTPPWIEARLGVPGSERSLSLLSLPEIGRGLLFDFRARAVDLAAAR